MAPLKKNEFEIIRKHTSLSSPWVEKIKTYKIWLYESVGGLKGTGKQGEEKMNETNIHTIADLKRHVRSYGFPKLTIQVFDRIYEHGMEAIPRKLTPSIKDHRKAKNPHSSRNGERWVDKLKSSSSMSTFCCINDPIWFMMKEAEKLVNGYVHEENLFIAHDALVLMTSKETITYMKENNYCHRWLLPMNG